MIGKQMFQRRQWMMILLLAPQRPRTYPGCFPTMLSSFSSCCCHFQCVTCSRYKVHPLVGQTFTQQRRSAQQGEGCMEAESPGTTLAPST